MIPVPIGVGCLSEYFSGPEISPMVIAVDLSTDGGDEPLAYNDPGMLPPRFDVFGRGPDPPRPTD
jgi:hypothetical protein